MDADSIENQRDQPISQRERRWSMNSQRLEAIVAQLMKPITNDASQTFDTNLHTLLEDYMTEAGIHALNADGAVSPNYIELAMVLQQSAAIYSRKVDFLYKHVLEVSEVVHNYELDLIGPAPDAGEAAGAGAGEGAGEGAAGRRGARAGRRGSLGGAGFERVELPREALRGPRDAAVPRPHPTLPNFFIDLEPRIIIEHQHVMHDYAAEHIGLLADFRASIEVPNRPMLVDEFEAYTGEEPRARPSISLVRLQADMAAAASPLPAPPSSPLRTSTPLPDLSDPVALDATDVTDTTDATDATDATEASAEPDASALLDTTAEIAIPVKKKRKRRHSVINIDDIIEGSMKIIINDDLRQQLSETREFSIPVRWIRRVVNKRKSHILSERRRLRELDPDPRAEFPGWSAGESAEAAAKLKGGRTGSPDSDDDGFFEQCSVGDTCETSRVEEPRAPDWDAWQAGVLARAAEAEARGGLDARALGRAVLRALPAARPLHVRELLRRTARSDREVSHVLLATLFLANAGNVRVLDSAPLSLDGFSLQLLSADADSFDAAADDQFLRHHRQEPLEYAERKNLPLKMSSAPREIEKIFRKHALENLAPSAHSASLAKM